ncbi:MAG: hypothetical protein FJX18_03180 [Alphaproteobacteria bacterium]|jgi:hypothetical protein|nr:hypothetical protein [Alphaproteobacteria bacterium]
MNHQQFLTVSDSAGTAIEGPVSYTDISVDKSFLVLRHRIEFRRDFKPGASGILQTSGTINVDECKILISDMKTTALFQACADKKVLSLQLRLFRSLGDMRKVAFTIEFTNTTIKQFQEGPWHSFQKTGEWDLPFVDESFFETIPEEDKILKPDTNVVALSLSPLGMITTTYNAASTTAEEHGTTANKIDLNKVQVAAS